jgi:hypothetical protein
MYHNRDRHFELENTQKKIHGLEQGSKFMRGIRTKPRIAETTKNLEFGVIGR